MFKLRLNPCPDCRGKRSSTVFVNTGPDSSGHYCERQQCRRCLGAGIVSNDVMEAIKKGRQLRQARVAKGLTMIEAARIEGISTAAVSARENGWLQRGQ